MEQGLQYLNSLMPWAGQGGFRLDPLKSVLSALGNPQDSYKTIHVAGTNGKGSVSALIAAGLGGAGYKVGLNTSPHLQEMNERFVIDGLPVSLSLIDTYALELSEVTKRVGVLLSYHEALTAIAFLLFRAEKVDYAVIEVGLGGRLDASNVIKRPEVTVITSIGLDHQDILGDSVEKIAWEKAGIIKQGVPVVTGALSAAALKVIHDEAVTLSAPIHTLEVDFKSDLSLEVPLNGVHQIQNGSVALKALELAGLSSIEIRNGIKSAFWPARLETLQFKGREVLLDCAHNEPGIDTLVNHLKFNNISNVVLGFGALETKRWSGMIDRLAPFVAEWHLFEPDSVRALSSDKISNYLSGIGIKAITYGKDYNLFINNISKIGSNRLILFTGSIYLIGKIRSLLDIPMRPIWTRKRS